MSDDDNIWQKTMRGDPDALALLSATQESKSFDLGGSLGKQTFTFCKRCTEPRDVLSGSDICQCTEAQLRDWLAQP